MKQIPNVRRIVGAVAVQVSNVLILDKMIEEFLDKLGIIFYTNMVRYPNVLSPQVLPLELKELAITKLEAIKPKLSTFKMLQNDPELTKLTLGQVQGVINFLKANDMSHLWNDCVEFNRKLDLSRNQSFVGVNSEFAPYV